jgi:hypothetical protein
MKTTNDHTEMIGQKDRFPLQVIPELAELVVATTLK